MTGEIIGRDAELDVVRAFLDRPIAGLRALVLEGDAGIGKSTIWQAGVAAARERSFRVLTSRPAETERTLSNVVLGDLFADTPLDMLDELPVPRRRAFDSALLLRGEPDGAVDPRALGVALLTLLPMFAAEQPLVIAIDDDQWMDASSADALGFALRRSTSQPVLLLLARRIGVAHGPTLEDEIDASPLDRLRVGPLSVGALQALIRQRLGTTLPRPTLVQIHEVSGGNAFYAVELARARAANPERDAALPLAAPANLDRLVSARLGSLGEVTRSALLLVAAHGRLPIPLLEPLGVRPEALAPAIEANVIETAGGVARFTHPLLASGIYHGAASDDRHAAHQRLANVLDDPVRRARHLALGADGPGHELAMTLESAASLAYERGMAIASAELAEHALRLTPSDADKDHHRRAIATARAHLSAGSAGRARSIVEDLLAQTGAGPRRAEVLILASELTDAPAPSLELLQEAMAEAGEDASLQAEIHANLVFTGGIMMGRAWTEPHVLASAQLAERLNDDRLRVVALCALADSQFDSGDPRAHESAREAYRLAGQLGDPRSAKEAAGTLGWILEGLGVTSVARPWLERELTLWRDRDEQSRSYLLSMLAMVELWAGRWDIASDYAEESREIGRQYDDDWPQAYTTPALVALFRGEISVAREYSVRALSLMSEQVLPNHHATLAICDLWSGDQDGALRNFTRAEGAADTRGWKEPNLRWWRTEYVEVLLQADRVDDAVRLVADWEAAAKRLNRERVLARAMRARGLVAAARGELTTAAELLEQAAVQHEAVEDPFGRARALLALGVVKLRARQKRAARSALESALDGFESLGAAGWAAKARAELARIGGRERIEGLSPSEQRVADLVAEGQTNREIAATLFLGERTVASHLTHIYAKLGLRSRTELARQMPQRSEVPKEVASKVPTS